MSSINVKIGDVVKAWKYVYYKEYSVVGTVEEIREEHGERTVKIRPIGSGPIDYYRVRNDYENRFKIIDPRVWGKLEEEDDHHRQSD